MQSSRKQYSKFWWSMDWIQGSFSQFLLSERTGGQHSLSDLEFTCVQQSCLDRHQYVKGTCWILQNGKHKMAQNTRLRFTAPLSCVSIKYLDQKCAEQNPDFLLILKRNKLSGTVSTCLYSVTAAHCCFDLKLQEQKQKYSSLFNTNKMCELSYK